MRFNWQWTIETRVCMNGTGSKTDPKWLGGGGGRRHVNGPRHSRATLSLKDAPREWRAPLLEVMSRFNGFFVLDDFGDGSAFTKDHQQFCSACLRPSMDAPLRYASAIDRPKQAARIS
jgi:hypothetical protein